MKLQPPAELHSFTAVMAFCKLLTALVLIHCCGAVLGSEVRSSIIGGGNANKGDWKWMVHLNISDGVNKRRCGGSILNKQWLLTAANCWERDPKPRADRSMAWIGAHDLHKESERYMAIVFHMSHPGYQAVGGGFVSDLALVKLQKKIGFSGLAGPVGLPSDGDTFDSSSECWITGWGNIRPGVPLPPPETLQQLRISILPQNVCKEKYPQMTAEQLCAGDLAGGKDACDGDYGGPLVCRKGAGFVQVGIMSYGSCGLAGRPGVYTRVSSYVDYIKTYINQEEASAEV
ncbi:tryptase-2-like [Notolabrus celidotus]|uniref:tryptase-2-like n=1 Tax=Notolabrus celidotus TaxID=1203425 RepID=UPI0014900DF0|nr:tryptase-2-like [Notolabrus celidotus]